jgi:hypothetical protein
VPQAILRVDEALAEKRVTDRTGPDVGSSLGIPPDVDGAAEIGETLGAREIGKRCREVFSAEPPRRRQSGTVSHRSLR